MHKTTWYGKRRHLGYTKITQFATQGRNAFNQWVTQYKLEYSEDGVTFHYYHEPGQSAPKVLGLVYYVIEKYRKSF